MTLNSLKFKHLDLNDEQIVLNFIEEEIRNIPKDFFYPPSLPILKQCLEIKTGLSLGAFDGKQIIGIRLSYRPALGKENHGYDLGYDVDALLTVVQFHGTIVKSDNRHKNIGNNLVKINCKEILKDTTKHILATVHPSNFNSIKMLKSNGFEKMLLTKKYDGIPRIIFKKEAVK